MPAATDLASIMHRTQPIGGRESWAMAESGDKFRFAMGLFNELPRLGRAVDALQGLGLDSDSMCLAGPRAVVERGSVLYCASGASRLVLIAVSASRPGLGETELWATDGPVLRALQLNRRFDLARSLAEDIWAELGEELRKGALLLIAKGSSAALQDQVVRALLRHSLHPVHSEELPVGH
jgi:hypothetical protein